MKIGVLTASVSRQAGGLFWSVRALTQGVTRLGLDTEVFSYSDRFSEQDRTHWNGLSLNLFDRKWPVNFAYSPDISRSINRGQIDLLHNHGLWMYPSIVTTHWTKKNNRPVVISPRGMLDSWALRNSATKKRFASWAFERRHLESAHCIHALCHSEYLSIRRFGLSNPVAVIPNGVDKATVLNKTPDWANSMPKDAKVLLFLSRIHPKKGLVNLLNSWAASQRELSTNLEQWQLVIAGWDQSGHQKELEELTSKLGIENQVRFIGPIFGDEKAAAFSRADAFVLPSRSEGLPMAVLEAWSYSLPVLMTPECNIPEGFSADAAINLTDNSSGMAYALKQLVSASEADLLAMGARGKSLVEERYGWTSISSTMKSVYEWLNGDSPVPDCVVFD